MTGKSYPPDALGVWLKYVDVNFLSDAEAALLARFDPSSDEGLDRIVRDWIHPRFEEWSLHNRNVMIEILSKSSDWDGKQLKPVYEHYCFPGEEVDFARYIEALRRHFLG